MEVCSIGADEAVVSASCCETWATLVIKRDGMMYSAMLEKRARAADEPGVFELTRHAETGFRRTFSFFLGFWGESARVSREISDGVTRAFLPGWKQLSFCCNGTPC